MKKIITKLFLVGVLSISSLNAKEIIFDLFDQDYKESMTDSPGMNKYKINDLIIFETNLIKRDASKYYRFWQSGVNGHANLIFTKDIINWKYSIDVTFDRGAGNILIKDKYINIYDKSGERFIIRFDNKGININGQQFKTEIDDQRVMIDIIKSKNILTILVDGDKIYEKPTKINIIKNIDTIINYKRYLSTRIWDILHSLKFINND
jgi:hypothetical protein